MADPRFRIEKPCEQTWGELTPRGAGRYCTHCDETVIDLSRLTRREAMLRWEERTCVRVVYDEQHQPVFRAEPERGISRSALAVVAALASGCASPLALSASEGSEAPADRAIEYALPSTAQPEPVVCTPNAEEMPFDGPTPEQQELTRRKHQSRRSRTQAQAPAAPAPSSPHGGYELIGDPWQG